LSVFKIQSIGKCSKQRRHKFGNGQTYDSLRDRAPVTVQNTLDKAWPDVEDKGVPEVAKKVLLPDFFLNST